MSSLFRLLSIALISGLSLSLVAACSSTPDTPDEAPRDMTAAADLLQTEDVIVAARVQPDELSTMTSMLQRFAQTSRSSELRDLADISPNPIGYLQSTYGLPNALPALDRDEPVFVLFSNMGNIEFLQSALLGMPTKTEEWPQYFNIRLLLPSNDVEALSTELGPWLDAFIDQSTVDAYRLFDGPGFVRVELALQSELPVDAEPINAGDWLDGLGLEHLQPPSAAEYRPTPAYDAFVDSDAPLGVWARADAFSTLGAFELLEVFSNEYDIMGPAGKPRFFLHGVARIAAAAVVDDPVSAEHEDLSLLVSSTDDEALVADIYATRTAQGARLHQALVTPLSLSGFSVDNNFLDATWQANLEALDQSVAPPAWASLEDWSSSDDFQAQFDGSNSFLPFAEDQAFLASMGAFLQYPWTSFNSFSKAIAGPVPLPQAIAVESFLMEDASAGLPLGAVMAAAFDDGPRTRMTIEQFLNIGESIMPGAFDAELVDRDDNLVELRVAVGKELIEVFGGSQAPREIQRGSLSLDLSTVGNMAAMIPGVYAIPDIDFVHLRGHSEPTYQTLRVTLGSPNAFDPQPVESRIEPRTNPTSRCRTEIAAASIKHLADLRTDPAGHVDRWARDVEEIAGKCLDANHPATALIQERIELTRQLAAEIP